MSLSGGKATRFLFIKVGLLAGQSLPFEDTLNRGGRRTAHIARLKTERAAAVARRERLLR
jgi:hypothetical protein